MKLDPPIASPVEISEDDWRRTPSSVKKAFALQELRIAQLEEIVVALQSKIEELEEKLRTNSSNSSKPPSGDQDGDEERRKKKKRKKKGKKRNRGGQPGHEGTTRELVPPDQVDDTIKCQASGCEHCECPDIEIHEGDFIRHQVFELPDISLLVIEFQQYRYWCPDCGE